MTLHTPDEAQAALCPLARTFAGATAQGGCHGPSCMAWRWEKVTTSHPLWLSSVRAKAAETGEKPPYAKAAAFVADNKETFGLLPTKGFCGIGGQP